MVFNGGFKKKKNINSYPATVLIYYHYNSSSKEEEDSLLNVNIPVHVLIRHKVDGPYSVYSDVCELIHLYQDGSGPVWGKLSQQPSKMKTLRWMPGGVGREPCYC